MIIYVCTSYCRQQDAHEFMCDLLEAISDDMISVLKDLSIRMSASNKNSNSEKKDGIIRTSPVSVPEISPTCNIMKEEDNIIYNDKYKELISNSMKDVANDVANCTLLPLRRRLHAEVTTILRCCSCSHIRHKTVIYLYFFRFVSKYIFCV